MPEHVREHLRKVQILVIEANYDDQMLELDKRRPWSTKQRIRGRHGHLSNQAAYELIEELSKESLLQNVYLAHLSKDCNNIELVREKFGSLLGPIVIKIVDPENGINPPVSTISN